MIVGSFTNIAKKKNSHSFGWARTWSENLGVEIDFNNQIHSKVYLLHGANFGGSLNLFGGFDEELETSIMLHSFPSHGSYQYGHRLFHH